MTDLKQRKINLTYLLGIYCCFLGMVFLGSCSAVPKSEAVSQKLIGEWEKLPRHPRYFGRPAINPHQLPESTTLIIKKDTLYFKRIYKEIKLTTFDNCNSERGISVFLMGNWEARSHVLVFRGKSYYPNFIDTLPLCSDSTQANVSFASTFHLSKDTLYFDILSLPYKNGKAPAAFIRK